MTTILKTPEHPTRIVPAAGRHERAITQQLTVVIAARENLARALYQVLDADAPPMSSPDVQMLQNELALAEANLQSALIDHHEFLAPLPVARQERFRNTAWLERLCHKRPPAGGFSGKPFVVRLPEALDPKQDRPWNGATNGHAMTLVSAMHSDMDPASRTLTRDDDVAPILRVLRDMLKPRHDWQRTTIQAIADWAGPAIPVIDYTVGVNVRPGRMASINVNRNLVACALPPAEEPNERCWFTSNERDSILLLRGNGWMSTVASFGTNDAAEERWKNPQRFTP